MFLCLRVGWGYCSTCDWSTGERTHPDHWIWGRCNTAPAAGRETLPLEEGMGEWENGRMWGWENEEAEVRV